MRRHLLAFCKVAKWRDNAPLSEHGDLSFSLFLSKQCLEENIQEKFQIRRQVLLLKKHNRARKF